MISDAAARSEALNPRKSFIVQAPAGSGKTGLLVYRLLRLLSTVDHPQEVLAITFTRKATAEMRERLLQLLRLAEQSQHSSDAFEQQGIDLAAVVLERDRALGWDILNSPHQMQILTIDSFCAKLTASMPWLSRLGDRPHTTDQADVHYAAAVEQLLNELLDPDSELSPVLQSVMLELDFNYNRARQLFASMLERRDQWLRHLLSNDLTASRVELEETWSQIVAQHLARVSDALGEPRVVELRELACHAAQVFVADNPETNSPLLGCLESTGENAALSLAEWKAIAFLLVSPSSGEYRKQVDKRVGFLPKTDEKERLLAILSELGEELELMQEVHALSSLPSVVYDEQDWQQLLALEQVLKSLAALLQLRFRAVGECDHSEVTQRANLALQELHSPTELGLRMDHALQHILVDEFQDTSTGQIELLRKLTQGWSEEAGANSKTLFLVGDPMQSIYRFREADVSLFLQVVANSSTQVFPDLEIEFLQLTENFRSSSGLVDWFNSTFDDSFPSANDVLTGAITYSAASSSRDSSAQSVHYHLAQDKQAEAARLTQILQECLGDLPKPDSKIAILVRSRSQLDYLLPSLQAAEIDYIGVDIQPLCEQQAVIDVVALCKALCRESDRLAWLALLRGPWCGLELKEIKALLGHNSSGSIWQHIEAADLASLQATSAARLERFRNLMRAAKQQAQQVDLSALTRWTWQNLGGAQTLFGASEDDIETVFELIGSLQRGGDLSSINDLDTALEGLFARPSLAAVNDAKIMVSTMHKAKGLQYDTVILPGLANPGRAQDKSLLMWAEQQGADGQANLLLAPLRLEPQADDHYNYLRGLDRARARNELIRLMYVATTRAERKLVLLGTAKVNDKTGELRKPNSGSLLATVWESLEQEFELEQSPSSAPPTGTELEQSLSRLPVDFSPTLGQDIDWQVNAQLAASDFDDLLAGEFGNDAAQADNEQQSLEYEWATEVAKGVGIVLHDWLQYNVGRTQLVQIDDGLRQRWRGELMALGVPAEQLEYGVKRLVRALENIQTDQAAQFLFKPYPIQQNEYSLTTYEEGVVRRYRIDRTFVDEDNIRWIVDYKSTDTRNPDIQAFVDEQVEDRHRTQLEKYGELLSQIDSRQIKLAVYFPLLKSLRVWSF